MKNFLTAMALTGLLGLTACSTIDLSQPKTQLSHSLIGSGAGLVQQNNELRVIMPTSTSFHPNGSRLTPHMKSILDKIVMTLKTYPALHIKVIGYTDNRGNPRTNQLISLRRALIVADYFRDHGIDSSRIAATGLGEANPIASNNTVQGRAENRRVEVVLVGD